MLDNVPANAITQSVEFSDNTLAKNFNLNNNNIESGQDYAVIPLFDDAHKVLGRDRYEQINTVSDYAGNTKPKNISFSITFNNPTISADAFNVNNLNVFIIVDGNRNPRKEIHVAGYQPTKLRKHPICLAETTITVIMAAKNIISVKRIWHGVSWFLPISNGL